MDKLGARLGEERKKDPLAHLEFDKDDETALEFVTATANIRAHIYHIPPSSRFVIKEMAGNIIPAIATTNAIIAGMIVMIAVKIVLGKINECKYVSVGLCNFIDVNVDLFDIWRRQRSLFVE